MSDDAPGINDSTRPARPPRKRRALWAFAALAFGSALAVRTPGVDALAWMLPIPALVLAAGLMRGWACAASLWLCAAALAAAWAAYRINNWSGAAIPVGLDLKWHERSTPVLLEVEGELVENPAARPVAGGALAAFAAQEKSWAVRLRVDRLWRGPEAVPARDMVRLLGPGELPDHLRLGQRVRVLGLFSALPPPMNPGGIDWRRFEAQRGRVGSLWVSDASLVRIESESAGSVESSVRRWVEGLRQRASRALPEGGKGAALVRSLLLGERSSEVGEARQAFQRLGLMHVLAISGFHLTVLAGAVLVVLRLTGDRGALEPLLASGVVLIYALVVPAEAPIIRSALMVLGMALGRALGRRYDDLNSLAWIGVLLLIWRPAELFALGFQLSFGLTACLVWLVPRVMNRHAPIRGIRIRRTPLRRAGRRLKQALVTTGACWLVSLPAIIHAIGAFSPVTVLASLVVAPVALLVMWFGFAVLLIGMLLPGAESPARPLLAWLGDLLAGTVLWLDDLPGTLVYVPAVSWVWALGGTALVVWAIAQGGGWSALKGGAALLWLAADIATNRAHAPHTGARIDALSLSGGSCTLIRAGNEAVLWDCGGGWPGAGERDIPRALRALGTARNVTLVLSEPGFEHLNSAVDVVEPLGIRRAIVSRSIADLARANPEGLHGTLLRELRKRGVEIDAAATSLALGQWRLDLMRTAAQTPQSVIRQERLHGLLVGPSGSALLTAEPEDARRRLEARPSTRESPLDRPWPPDLIVRTSAEGARASDGTGVWVTVDTFGEGPLSAGATRLSTRAMGAASVWIGPRGRTWKVRLPHPAQRGR